MCGWTALFADRNVAAKLHREAENRLKCLQRVTWPCPGQAKAGRVALTWHCWPINSSRWEQREQARGHGTSASCSLLFLNSPVGSGSSEYEVLGCLLSHHEKWAIQDFLPNLMANYLPFFVLWPPRMSPYLIYFQVLPSLWDSVFSWEVISQCR